MLTSKNKSMRQLMVETLTVVSLQISLVVSLLAVTPLMGLLRQVLMVIHHLLKVTIMLKKRLQMLTEQLLVVLTQQLVALHRVETVSIANQKTALR